MCSVYSKARDVGYDDLEFGLPKITTLFILGRHGLGEREKKNYFINVFILFSFGISPFFYQNMDIDLERAFICCNIGIY